MRVLKRGAFWGFACVIPTVKYVTSEAKGYCGTFGNSVTSALFINSKRITHFKKGKP